ncbi:hypothetical protein HMPREF0578_0753 [Mobiluncus mulieris 28-1]|nr:hypothetical protein HMPREF0578_0753 [Mobiluncus mulieris 28-1]
MSKGLIAFYAAVAGFAVYELFTSRSFFILFLGIYIYSLKRDMGKREGKNSRYRGFFGTGRGDRID